jgi:hypothetical protein
MAARKLTPWTALKPHRKGVALERNALLGHLHWWREGSPAEDLTVPGVKGPGGVDWTGFPTEPPEGYEEGPPRKRASGGRGPTIPQAERKRKQLNVTISEEAFEALGRVAARFGGNKSAAVEAGIKALDDEK